MKIISFLFSSAIVLIGFSACKTSTTTPDSAHNSQNSVDWEGIYKGKSATDGIEKALVVNLEGNKEYSMQTAVLSDGNDNVTESKGTFSWSKDGSEVILKDSNTGKQTTFKVGENKLMEKNGNNSLSLTKVIPSEITDKYWKLIEINGKPVVKTEGMRREPYIILNSEYGRLNGSGGCNSINAGYEIKEGNRVTFTKAVSTLMACPDMAIEAELLQVLETIDNYSLSADGKNLSLNKARMAPLARFEVVYLR